MHAIHESRHGHACRADIASWIFFGVHCFHAVARCPSNNKFPSIGLQYFNVSSKHHTLQRLCRPVHARAFTLAPVCSGRRHPCRLLCRKEPERENGATWDCGTALQPRMEITSTGFARSIITIFKGILQPTKQTDIEYHDSDIRYFPKTKSVLLGTHDIYRSHFYKPLQEAIVKISESIKHIQSGSTNAYVAYIFIMLIVLLALYFK